MANNENNKVHYDLEDVYAAPLTIGEDGTPTFGDPEKLNGSISIDLSAQGDLYKLRADGMDYYKTYGNNGYSGNLNMAEVPDWFKVAHLGETKSAKDGVLVENATAEHAPFALLFGFKGDVKKRRHVLYNCMANRLGIKGENKENMKEADTESLPIVALPLADGRVKASTSAETPDSVLTNWNKTVWLADTTA